VTFLEFPLPAIGFKRSALKLPGISVLAFFRKDIEREFLAALPRFPHLKPNGLVQFNDESFLIVQENLNLDSQTP
jgi:hypothetical protein